MKSKIVLSLGLISTLYISFSYGSSAGFGTHWTYCENPSGLPVGPSRWNEEYPSCGVKGSSERQSPVDIIQDDIISKPKLNSLDFTGYSATAVDVFNTGDTVNVVPHALSGEDGVAKTLTLKGGLTTTETFNFASAHFHWHPTSNSNGTEHAMKGHKAAIELHLVHYNSKWSSLTEAATSGSDGDILVVAVFFHISQYASTLVELDKIVSLGSTSLANPSEESKVNGTHLATFEFRNLLPKSTTAYYHYNGSTTTPGCYPIVRWFVYQKEIYIPQAQLTNLRKFRHTENATNTSLSKEMANVRPLQPMNNRKVWAYPSDQDADTFEEKMSGLGVAVALLVISLLVTVAAIIVFVAFLIKGGNPV